VPGLAGAEPHINTTALSLRDHRVSVPAHERLHEAIADRQEAPVHGVHEAGVPRGA